MRKGGLRGEVFLRHAHQLVGLPIADDLHPVVFEKPEVDFSIREQAHQFQQLFRGDGASPLFFHFGAAGG